MAACRPPEAAPLDTPEQLLGWHPDADGELCRAAVQLPSEGPAQPPGRPRLLACHDMAGGYHEDRYVQGHSEPPAAGAAAGPPSDPYILRHWRCLDTFAYFSHRLVTIPPPGWVNAAHTHGVRVLGTLITEWDAGAAACRTLFGTREAAEAAAAALTAIAAHRGFEGWLINIENAVDPAHIPHLLHFLRVLSARMREVAGAWSQVVWYDAVTVQGKLQWQNTLNRLNRPFFDACDAIWINYTWKRGTPAAARREVRPAPDGVHTSWAGERAGDIFMGVDCFGRGSYGGGGWRCDVALRACLDAGLSAALFATAWPYEGNCGPNAPACWRERDARFWHSIQHAWLGGAGSSGSSGGGPLGALLLQLLQWLGLGRLLAWAQHPGPAAPPAAPATAAAAPLASAAGLARQLPLWSDFCAGRGCAMWQRGRLLSPQPWFNLSLQALQPVLEVCVGSSSGSDSSGSPPASGGSSGGSGSWVEASVTDEGEAFSRGSCVSLAGALLPGQLAAVSLFPATAPLAAGGLCVRLVAVHNPAVEARLALRLGGSSSSSSSSSSIELPLLPPGEAALAAPAAAWGSGSAVAAAATAAPVAGTCWVCWQWQLSPDLLAAASMAAAAAAAASEGPASSSPDGTGSDSSNEPQPLLVGVDVLLRGAAQAASGFEMRLGELCVEAAVAGGREPAPPASVQCLSCSLVQAEQAPGVFSGSGTAMLTARLAWQPPPGEAPPQCCHVWCWFEGNSGGELAAPAWLGTACADGYVAAGLEAPQGAATAVFAVQPEGASRLVQELVAAARLRVRLPAAARAAGAEALVEDARVA